MCGRFAGIGAKRTLDMEWQENTRNLNALYAALAPATKTAPGAEPAKPEEATKAKHVQSSRTLYVCGGPVGGVWLDFRACGWSCRALSSRTFV